MQPETDARVSLIEEPPVSFYEACGEVIDPGTRAAACLTTLQVAVTKIFLAGVGWQAAAFASRQSSTSFAFWAASFPASTGPLLVVFSKSSVFSYFV